MILTQGEKMVWAAAFVQGLVATAEEVAHRGVPAPEDLNQHLADRAASLATGAVERMRQARCACDAEDCVVKVMLRAMRGDGG